MNNNEYIQELSRESTIPRALQGLKDASSAMKCLWQDTEGELCEKARKIKNKIDQLQDEVNELVKVV